MILKIIIVLSITALLAILVNILEERRNRVHIPFKESMDLLSLPVVTFNNGDFKLHLLLDTGSDDSYIDCRIKEELLIKSTRCDSRPILTAGGVIDSTEIVDLEITYKNSIYSNEFVLQNFTMQFDDIRENTGVTIHGILGSRFFERYKYVLDFKDMAFYSRG